MRHRYGIIGILFVSLLTVSMVHAQVTTDECMECHAEEDLAKVVDDTIEVSLYVDFDKFSNSVHGGFDCVDCHMNIEEIPHEEELEHPNCNMCHDDVEELYAESFHGEALAAGDRDAPYCWDCHSSHYVYSGQDSLSLTSKLNQPEMCATCHSNPSLVRRHHIPIENPSELYETSVHFLKLKESGSTESASCSDCHGAHELYAPNHPKSKINKLNIPETCSACHADIYDEYIESIHGTGLMEGRLDNPVCTDCHAEHAIKPHTDPTSAVYSAVVSQTLCADCHEAARIVDRYGLLDNVVESYQNSYHGLAVRAGSVVSANCASCHGIHNIRPSSDPESTIHDDNLAETCGECHPGASAQVTRGSVHIYPSPESDKIVYYVTIFYYMMIFGVIGGMIIHNGLDFRKKFAAKFRGEPETHFDDMLDGEIVRLTFNERIQHFLLMGSFTLLVYTGFVLKYPEAWWAAPLVGWEGAFEVRSWLHRLAALVMVGLSIYHVIYLITTRRGKDQFKALLPTFKDITDVIQMFKYYLGLASEKPRFERYNYIEKAEYWALIWGTIVMSITGFILWFENISLRFLPKWITDVSTVIHLYEAILATLAILVWHFYFQFLDPHVYPMNSTCITGKMKEKDYKEEHPLHYEQISEEGE